MPIAKLTASEVLEIYHDTRSQPEIAIDYDISYNTINAIKRKRNWRRLLAKEPDLPCRFHRGRPGNTRLTAAQVKKIRKDHRPSWEVARDYRVADGTIRSMWTGRTWAGLTDGVQARPQKRPRNRAANR